MEQVLAVVRNAVEAIALRAAPDQASAPPPTSVMLESLLDLREPVEDAGRISVGLVDVARRLINPRKTGTMVREASSKKLRIYSVDSSSRAVETGFGAVIVASVAVTTSPGLLVYEWPPLGGPGPERAGPPFIAVVGVPGLDGSSMVRARSPSGHSYEEYSIEQAMDEMRLTLENWALQALEPHVRRDARRGLTPVVMIDGPVLPVTMAFQGEHGAGRRKYVEAWRRILWERERAVRGLERAGALVLGVVKRVERSRIIQRLAERGVRLRWLPGRGHYGDAHALAYALARYLAEKPHRPGRVYATPRLRVEAVLAGSFEREKIAEYIVIPPGSLVARPASSRYYRVEYTRETFRALEALELRGAHPLVLDSVARGGLEPVAIAAADRRAKSVSKALRDLAAVHAQRLGVPLAYTTVLEVERGWPEARQAYRGLAETWVRS